MDAGVVVAVERAASRRRAIGAGAKRGFGEGSPSGAPVGARAAEERAVGAERRAEAGRRMRRLQWELGS